MPGFARGLLLGAAMALSGTPAAAADQKHMIEAQKVLRACFDNLPDSRQVRAAFKAVKLRPEGVFGSYHAFSGLNWKLMGMTAATLSSDSTPECGVMVDQMSIAEAQILAAPFLKEIGAGRARTNDRNIAAVFAGVVRGQVMAVAIFKEEDAYYLKGSAVIFQMMGPVKK